MPTINELSYAIYKNGRCKNCGGSLVGNTCEYCGNIDKNMYNLIGDLEKQIATDSSVSLNDYIGLYSIRNMNIDIVSKLLDENNHYVEEINNMVKKSNPNNEDNKVFLNLLRFGIADKSLSVNIMDELVKDKLDFSKEEQKEVIKYFTENYASNYVKRPVFEYRKTEACSAKQSGGALYNYIYLNENDIDKCIENKDYSKILEFIFHEVTHTMQFSRFHESDPSKYSYFNLLMAKEQLISSKNEAFYKENYLFNSMEVEARYYQKRVLLSYCKSHNIPLENSEKYEEEAKEEETLFLNEIRFINGEKTTIDEEFKKINLDKKDLNEYPILKTQYKIEDNKVVKKTKKEIENDYESLIDNSKSNNLQESLYRRLFEMAESNNIDL